MKEKRISVDKPKMEAPVLNTTELATLSYDLTDAEARRSFELALKSHDLALSVTEILELFRQIVKYGKEGFDADEADKLRSEIIGILERRDVLDVV